MVVKRILPALPYEAARAKGEDKANISLAKPAPGSYTSSMDRNHALTVSDAGRRGARAVLRKYGRAQMRKWGKLGGRPKKQRKSKAPAGRGGAERSNFGFAAADYTARRRGGKARRSLSAVRRVARYGRIHRVASSARKHQEPVSQLLRADLRTAVSAARLRPRGCDADTRFPESPSVQL